MEDDIADASELENDIDAQEARLEKEYDKQKNLGMVPEFNKKSELSLSPETIDIMTQKMQEREAPLDDVMGTEEATAKALIELVRTDRINLLTDLTMEEIQMLMAGEMMGDYLFMNSKSDLLQSLCLRYKELKVSLHRKGRTEIVSLGAFVNIGNDNKKGGLFGQLGGLGR